MQARLQALGVGEAQVVAGSFTLLPETRICQDD